MVEIKNFDEFFSSAKSMMQTNPTKTRYSFKYKSKPAGVLVLKVTDGSSTLKFATNERADFKRIEELTGWMLAAMSQQEEPI